MYCKAIFLKWPKLKKTARSTMLGKERQCQVWRRENKHVFSCRLNDSRDGAERIDAGKLFHVRGLVIGNERSPTVTNQDCGTKRISVSADDLSRRLESMSATRCSDDDRYGLQIQLLLKLTVLFTFSTVMRGHKFKLSKQHARANARKTCFVIGVFHFGKILLHLL